MLKTGTLYAVYILHRKAMHLAMKGKYYNKMQYHNGNYFINNMYLNEIFIFYIYSDCRYEIDIPFFSFVLVCLNLTVGIL